MSAYPQHIDNHRRHSDRNRGVGDVEYPEMPRAPVHVDEVDDRPCDDAIYQITCSTADDECEADASDDLMPREARRVNTHADHRCRCDHRDDDRLEREVDTLQKAV